MLRSLATSSIALIVGASPVFADLTPAQVWENLSKYYTDTGYTVKVGEETETADGLELSNVELLMDVQNNEEASSKITVLFPKLTFSEAENASVKSVMEGDVTMKMIITPVDSEAPSEAPSEDAPSDAEPINFDIVISASENETISSGSPDDIRHEYDFPTLKMTLKNEEPITDGDEAAEVDILGAFTLNQLTGFTTIKDVENWQTEQEIAVETVDFELSVSGTQNHADPVATDNGGQDAETPAAPRSETFNFAGKGNIDGLNVTGQGVIPSEHMDMSQNLDKALEAGLDIDATIIFGAMTGDFNVESSDFEGTAMTSEGKFTSGGGDAKLAMAKDGISYGSASKATEIEMTTSNLPFPIKYAIENSSFNMLFPVSKSDEAQTFKLSYALGGLTIGDEIWNLFDGQKQLPRDPANIEVDVEGLALVTQNLFDPEVYQQKPLEAAQSEPGDAVMGETDGAEDAQPLLQEPVIPQSIKINKIALDAVGAKADVTGDLTIPEGAQQPVGTLEGDFTGVNALLDKLVAAGLVPQEQVMGARMMMSMFAKTVDGNPDQLHSEMEFKEDGSIFANGQKIK